MTQPPPESSVAVTLAEIRGEIVAGFARVDGALALLVHRSDQTDKTIADHETRLDSLERSRWPVASVGALTGVGGLCLALWTYASR